MSVVVVVTRETGVAALCALGRHVARAYETRLVVLWLQHVQQDAEPVIVDPRNDSLPASLAPEVASLCAQLAAQAPDREPEPAASETDEADDEPSLDAPPVEVRWLRCHYHLRTVLSQLAEVGADYLVVAKHVTRQRRGVSLARKLFNAAPCHTLLVRLGAAAEGACTRILVPTADGRPATDALRLGERLGRGEEDGGLIALRVEPDAAELAEAVGARLLDRALARAGLEAEDGITPRVVLAGDRDEGVHRVAAEDGFDLLLQSAIDAGALRGQLFGNLANRLLAEHPGAAVAVVRRRWTLADRLRRQLGRWLDVTIPQLARDERVRLYESLEAGSIWRFDFMTLIGLSTAIAAFGLLQSSAAVVIGAMLVAPLMTPILGAGLALLQGNRPLLASAAKAIALGYLLALAIGFGIGWSTLVLDASTRLTPELVARGAPGLIDMAVALFSGIAAAYCLGRPGLGAALPGVAIAAALVPPIATTGVSLALGAHANAAGSALLFGTNVVAIVLGAAISFYAVGVRGRSGASRRQHWVRLAFLGLLLGATLLGAALASFGSAKAISHDTRAALESVLEAEPGVELLSATVKRGSDPPRVQLRVAAPEPLRAGTVTALAAAIRELESEKVEVVLETELRVVLVE